MEKIKELREKQAMSQADLAAKAGLTQSRVSRIESQSEMWVWEVVAIADALKVKPAFLFNAVVSSTK